MPACTIGMPDKKRKMGTVMKKRPGMIWILGGFAPWILYWVLSGPEFQAVPVAAALIAALLINAYRWPKRNFKALEVITLVFFAAHFVFTVVLGASFFVLYGPILSGITLAFMAWGTLLAGSPFTYQYARDEWDEAYWDDPSFRRINVVITSLWGVIFTVNTLMSATAVSLDLTPSVRFWLMAVLPNAGIALGIVFSIRYPDWSVRRELREYLRALNPYQWDGPDFKVEKPEGANRHDVIVIGSGIGGLTAAALLAKRGRKVVVFEQHYQAGGYCSSWTRSVKRGGEKFQYTFDAGVHDVSGLGKHGPVRNLLKQLGIQDVITWRHMAHEYLLEGLRFRVPPGEEGFERVLIEHFPHEQKNIHTFMEIMLAIYREMQINLDKTGGVPRPPDTVEAMLNYPKTHPHTYKWGEVTFRAMLDRFFTDEGLKELLLVLSEYLGDDPDALSVSSMAPIFGYYFDGGYYPVGGSRAFADALVDVIEAHHGVVRLKSPVSRVLVEGGKAVGVLTAGGQTHYAGAVVANSDLHKTFLELIDREHLPEEFIRQIQAYRPSTSAFLVTLGLDCLPDIAPITMVDDILIATPSLVDPDLAPAGHAAVELMKLVSSTEFEMWTRRDPEYKARKKRLGDELIKTAEKAIPNLRQHIVYRQEASPATFARYAWTTSGSIYGPAAGQPLPSPKTPVERLYLAGAGTFPGPGIEAVVISGTIAADMIDSGLPAAP